MKIVQITAGAGGRLCGSCLHDNALVRALRQRDRDAMLVPAYVPTTSDEENVAEPIVVMVMPVIVEPLTTIVAFIPLPLPPNALKFV